jgi:hypothetical protein
MVNSKEIIDKVSVWKLLGFWYILTTYPLAEFMDHLTKLIKSCIIVSQSAIKMLKFRYI